MTDNSKSRQNLGPDSAQLKLYLPNPPVMSAALESGAIDIAKLIEGNGNHWRKILTILAKLGCGTGDWKAYRDNELLHHSESICFDDRLREKGRWHVVAGKASWQRLGFLEQEGVQEVLAPGFTALDEQGLVYYRDNVILTPYPDYRQFPNALIGKVVSLLQND